MQPQHIIASNWRICMMPLLSYISPAARDDDDDRGKFNITNTGYAKAYYATRIVSHVSHVPLKYNLYSNIQNRGGCTASVRRSQSGL